MGSQDNRFATKWINSHELTKNGKLVIEKTKRVYELFYENSSSLPWPQYKIENWDCGWYQIRNSLEDAGVAIDELVELAAAVSQLRQEILPCIYELGFLADEENLFSIE